MGFPSSLSPSLRGEGGEHLKGASRVRGRAPPLTRIASRSDLSPQAGRGKKDFAPQALRRLLAQTFRNRGRAGKATPGAERGNGRAAAAQQGDPRGANARFGDS